MRKGLFERLQAMLRERPLPDVGSVTVSGGIAELLPTDDGAALVVRADAALGLAKGSGRDTVVTAARGRWTRASRPSAPGASVGRRLVERQERGERREPDDAELGQAVALADEAALGGLLPAERPARVRVCPRSARSSRTIAGPRELVAEARRARSCRRAPDRETALDRPHRRAARPVGTRNTRLGSGGRDRDARPFREPARRRRDDDARARAPARTSRGSGRRPPRDGRAPASALRRSRAAGARRR